MTKRVTFGAAVSATVIGDSTKARVRARDGQVQVLFTNRASTVNLDKSEKLIDLGVKGSGRRLSIPADIAQDLEIGTQVQLINDKYGWKTLAAVTEGATAAGRVSA